jgi:two-component system LytT family response regulator
MKPIDADELRNAADRFMVQSVIKLNEKSLYKNLLHNISAGSQKDFRLALPTNEGTYFFQPAEIIRLEGESNYTRFIFAGRKPLLTSKTLKEYEEILAIHGFIRTHKSHLVNKQHVINFTADGFLVMNDQSKVEISRRRKEEVMNHLKSK